MLTVTKTVHSNNLRRFNNFLTVVVIVLGSYIIAAPFAPRLLFWWQQGHAVNNGYKYESHLTQTTAPPSTKSEDLAPPPPNHHLFIPQMQIDAEIHEGTDARALDKGVWRRPKTSTPDKGGNTVLVAHRFTYTGSGVFYNLDKLQKGHTFAVFWDKREYDYEVIEVKVVNPDAIYIEENTKEPIMTLYTCTPMWTAKQRLVVVAKLVSNTALE